MSSPLRRFSRFAAIGVFASALVAPAAGEDSLDPIRAEYERGDLERALSRLETHLGSAPADVEGLFLKGAVLADLGRRSEALTAFSRVVQIDPSLPEAYNNLAVLHAAEGRYQQAIDVLKSALGTHPSYHAAFDNLSKLYARLASDAYSRALGVREQAEPNISLVLLRDVERRGEGDTPATSMAPVEPVVAAEPLVADSGTGESVGEWRTVTVDSPEPPLAEGAPVVEIEGHGHGGESDTSELGVALQGWADAWSNQDVDRYLAAYARDFVPSDGLERSVWESQRRDRLSSPSYVRVSVALLDAWLEGPTFGSVRFLQSYESDSFSDSVTKVLRLVREDGEWKIFEERVETP